MRSVQLGLTVAMVLITGVGSASPPGQECLHGRSETPGNRARREQAIEVARKINEAEAAARGVGPCGGTRPYQPLERLLNIPPVPPGFSVQHHADAATYAVSIKDTLDACRYGVFSDQSGDIYEATPSGPREGGLKLLSQK